MTHIIRGHIFGNRPAGNYSTFEDDGSIGYFGDASFWDDLRVAAQSVKPGASAPDWDQVLTNGSGSTGVFTYLFDKNTAQEVNFCIQIPHSWLQGSALHPHVHWFPIANGSAGQKVCWGLEYSFAELGGTFGNTNIIYGDITSVVETFVAKRHYLTSLPNISMAGVDSVSSMLICRLFRDAGGTGGTDDYANDVGLLEFDVHIQIDRPGSRTEYEK